MKMRAKPFGTALALAFVLALSLSTSPRLAGQENSAPKSEQNNQDNQQKPKVDYALLYGTVWDKNDHPAYGVPIKIRRADQKKAKWELTSDHQGEFAQRVPVGQADYLVWADIKVPKGQQRPETKVHIEYNERKDFSLHLTR